MIGEWLDLKEVQLKILQYRFCNKSPCDAISSAPKKPESNRCKKIGSRHQWWPLWSVFHELQDRTIICFFFLTAQRKQKRNIFNYALQQWKSWLEQVSHCIPLETSSYATESESPSPGHRGLVLFFLCFFASQPDVLGEGVCLTIRFWRWVTILDNTWELDVAYFLNATRCRTGGFCDCISRWSTSTI